LIVPGSVAVEIQPHPRPGNAPASFFIAGTDTGVGKTRMTAGLLAAGRAAGLRVAGMKPVAAGAEWHDGRLFNEDAVMIADVSGQNTPYEWLNPYCLPDPLSPHIAARRAKVHIDIRVIAAAARHIAAGQELFLVEGAGGWHAPISSTESMADVARALEIPVLLVVGLKLGCLNHARLTHAAILDSGCGFAGWAGSQVDPDFAALEDNCATLEQLLAAPPIAILPYRPDRSGDAQLLAAALPRLLARDGVVTAR
jgi:dethiobiotin synthetase